MDPVNRIEQQYSEDLEIQESTALKNKASRARLNPDIPILFKLFLGKKETG